jgi:histidine triad (HIT) family protein
MENCIFCKIISKDLPSKIVTENENVIAIEDINPKAPVHILILPKKHIPTILNIDENDKDLIFEMFKVAIKIAKEKNIAVDGFRLVLNCNPAAGQSVYHIHMHLLGGRIFGWPPG